MNLSVLTEDMWNVIRTWDYQTLKMAAKMMEPLEEVDE